MAQQMQPQTSTALVIGASMAGLLAARVLSDFYADVVIVERDTLTGASGPRKGVPQGRHAHALLPRGQQILEELFPGLTQRLVDDGAPMGFGRFVIGGAHLAPVREDAGGLFVSRPRLEAEVRARVLAAPQVRLVEDCDVLGLAASADQSRITGVRVIRRQAESAEEILPADLVVDASGRGSRTPAWIEALGYPRPAVELVEVDMGYATRLFRREPEHLDGDLMVNIAPTRALKRGCGMMAQEDAHWIVTLAGYFGDRPPTDEQGFLDFARSLPVPDVYDIVRRATPLSELAAYRFPADQRRHYEKLARFPGGLLVMGDALCSFTPIYGQGMTVAALEALALRACLRAGREQLAARFFKQASRAADGAWTVAAGNDKKLSGAADKAPPVRFINWYMDKLLIAARRDRVVARAFLDVSGLLAAPPSVLRPLIALRVLWAHLRPGARLAGGQAASSSQPEPVRP